MRTSCPRTNLHNLWGATKASTKPMCHRHVARNHYANLWIFLMIYFCNKGAFVYNCVFLVNSIYALLKKKPCQITRKSWSLFSETLVGRLVICVTLGVSNSFHNCSHKIILTAFHRLYFIFGIPKISRYQDRRYQAIKPT